MAISGKNITRLLSVSGIIMLVLHTLALHLLFAVPCEVAFVDALINTAMFVLAGWALTQSIRLYPTKAGIIPYSLFIAALFGEMHVYLSTATLDWWLGDASYNYIGLQKDALSARYIIYWMIFGWLSTHLATRKNIDEQKKSFKEQTDATTLLKEAELFKLRQQLQPHFLYNSLNSISALTITNPEKAQEMIGQLSDFLRNSVKKENHDKVSLLEELNYLNNYLAIEAVRFGDRLNIDIEQNSATSATIPPFLLQPILENAIKFGVYGNTGKVTITVKIGITDKQLTIVITNPYDSSAKPQKGTGFGLKGVRRRLFLLYGRNDLLNTEKDDNTFTTTLKIPQDAQSNINR